MTNWHVVTGIDANTGKRISNHKGSPSGLIIHPGINVSGNEAHYKLSLSIALYDAKQKPRWYEHPEYGKGVDVVAIGINPEEIQKLIPLGEPESEPIYVNNEELGSGQTAKMQTSDDVFIIGFPFGLGHKGRGLEGLVPLWKRGTIASAPSIDYDDMPKFLVDTASRPGMSGSPVFFMRYDLQHSQGAWAFKRVHEFCGIYSGRIRKPNDESDTQCECKCKKCKERESDELDTQLGIVWKREVIAETIKAKKKGTEYYPDKNCA